MPVGRERQSPRETAFSKWEFSISISFGISVAGTEHVMACMPEGEYVSTSRRIGDATRNWSLSVHLGYD